VVLGGGGCFDAAVPAPLPPIACVADEDCPDGVCVDNACVDGAGGDVRPPGVVADSVVVTPTVAGPGTTVTVAFRTDEAVSGVPEVVGGDGALRFTGGGSGDDVFAYAATIGAVTDGALAITATLADAAGNTGTAILGVVVVDTTGPVVVDVSVPDLVAAGAPFAVTLHADEALASARCALRALGPNDGEGGDVDGVVRGADATCTLVAAGGLGASWALDVTLTDRAGNTRASGGAATIVITN
jgi:hypothetical protein